MKLCRYQCPLGESSLSEERATAPSPPLADARRSRKREGESLDLQRLKNCTTSKREGETENCFTEEDRSPTQTFARGDRMLGIDFFDEGFGIIVESFGQHDLQGDE